MRTINPSHHTMLFRLPYGLSLAIFKEWLDDLRTVSALDVAFCNKALRPKLLDLISDDRDPTVPLDQFTETGRSASVIQGYASRPVCRYVEYLQWSRNRNWPDRRLCLHSAHLNELTNSPDSLFPIRQQHVESLYYLVTDVVSPGSDFQAISRVLKCCPHLTSVNILCADEGEVDFSHGMISALTIFPNIPLKAFRACENSQLTDLGVCMLAQTFSATLDELRLSNANISDKSIRMIANKCKRLQIIDLNCNSVSLAALSELADACKKIWFFSVRNVTFDDKDLDELVSHLKALEVFRCHNSPDIDAVSFLRLLRAFPSIAVADMDDIALFKSVSVHDSADYDTLVASSVTMLALSASNISHGVVRGRFVLHERLCGADGELCVPLLSAILDALPAEHINMIVMETFNNPHPEVVFPSAILPKIGDKFGQHLDTLEMLLGDDVLVEDLNYMLSSCSNLTSVALYGCSVLSDFTLEVIGMMLGNNLRRLNLQNAPHITDNGMAALLVTTGQLKDLVLAKAGLIGVGTLQALLDSDISLENLLLVKTKVSIDIMREFMKMLTAQGRTVRDCHVEE